ncbi:MAG: hypothetical protein A2007_04355 [Verrucomicrobia bacterium GWC2_42_7]|nr:MAG: hypothetical protein A2007_04355 [Verrucomicrobia bacterium GWC2_42_7]
MAKVDIDLVKKVMQRHLEDGKTVSQILSDISSEVKIQEAEAEMEPPPPPIKKQFVILVSDPNNELDGKDFVGWVVQIPENESPMRTEEKIFRSAYEHNLSRKGRRYPVKTIAEACEAIPTRIFKDQNIWVKNKEAVFVVRTSNEIPLDKSNLRKSDF